MARPVYQIKAEIEELELSLKAEPARKFIKYIKRYGGHKGEIKDFTPRQYREITGKAPKQAIIRNGKITWDLALDQIASEFGYRSDQAFKNGIEKALKLERRIDSLKDDLKEAKEKEKAGVKCGTTIKAVSDCQRQIHGDWCKAKVITCNGMEAIAVRQPTSWTVHVVKAGSAPTDENKAGEVRYATDARKSLRQIAQGMEEKYGSQKPKGKKRNAKKKMKAKR